MEKIINRTGLTMMSVLYLIAAWFLVVTAGLNHNGNTRDFPTYETHPCMRTCQIGRPQNCYYEFTLEYYYTLSKACYDCPFNKSDCSRPQCVPADGAPRAIQVVNRMLPGPAIHVCQGDQVVVYVENDLVGAEGTSIHWHGVHQRGTPFMDGVGLLTQCPISQKSTFQYKFNASNPGTHFWHSHSGLQRADGLFGALVIRQPKELEPHHGLYDEDLPEHTIVVNDWLSELATNRFTHYHQAGGDNLPRSMLINGKGIYQEFFDNADTTTQHTPVAVFNVTKGTRYRFRIISSALQNCPIQLSVDNHTLMMIASDGNPFEAVEVDSFNIFAGERYDFVLDASMPVGNYWVRARGFEDCTDKQAKQVAILRYQGAPDSHPDGNITWNDANRQGKKLNPWKQTGPGMIPVSQLVNHMPKDLVPTFKEVPDKRFYIAMQFSIIDNYLYNDANYFPIRNVDKDKKIFLPQLNHRTNLLPPSPPLTQFEDIDPTQFCDHASWQNKNCSLEFCECIHMLKADLGDDVEIVLYDEETPGVSLNSNHPLHMHGYSYYVVGMGTLPEDTTLDEVKQLDREGHLHRNLTHAVAKDTVSVPDGGYVILRIKADNPGFWFFHCHIEFHADIGMGLFLQTGALTDMPNRPKNFPRCGSWAYTGQETN